MQKKYAFQNKMIFIILLLLLFKIDATAQNQNTPFWSNVRIGGGIGLSFGDGFFSGTLAPSAVYDFDENFSLGLGLNGTYNSSENFYTATIFGGSILALYNVIPQLQVSAEFEELFVNRNYENSQPFLDESYSTPALFLGAGFRQKNITFGVRYDALFNENKSIYASSFTPFVRVYF